jgi:hypothetical protein
MALNIGHPKLPAKQKKDGRAEHPTLNTQHPIEEFATVRACVSGQYDNHWMDRAI